MSALSGLRSPSVILRAALAAVGAVACNSSSSTAPPPLTFTKNPCLPVDTVRLSVAATLRLDCTNGGTTATFAGGGASYLIVPEFATDQAPFQLVDYSVASGTLAATAAASRVRANLAGLRARPLTAQYVADSYLRERGRELARASVLRTARVPGPSLVSSAPPDTIRSFQVLSNFSAGTFTAVAARLAYTGTNLLLYLDTLAPAGFTPQQLQTFGTYFDQTLWPIDTTAFGQPSDIDQNGRVIMLMSKVVNADTPAATCNTQGFVAGFFNPEDFAGPSDPHSNQGEVFYSVVPDPNGVSSCAHSVDEVGFDVPSIFLHELQHLISFSQHVVVGGGQPEASWLDEGQSIAAEELGSLYYENRCPPPSCRTDPAQLFPDSAQGFVQDFLVDSYLFGLLPDTASITLESDDQGGESWRGGAWLLVRWLADQGGAGIYRKLELGPAGGVANIVQAAGRPFPDLFADFGLALYTDSLPGLPRATAPAPDRFTSRNLRQLWARLYTTTPQPSNVVPLPMPVQLFAVTGDTTTAVLFPGTVTYFRLDTPASSAVVSVRFAAPGGAAFPAALVPQMAVFRLPPGQ